MKHNVRDQTRVQKHGTSRALTAVRAALARLLPGIANFGLNGFELGATKAGIGSMSAPSMCMLCTCTQAQQAAMYDVNVCRFSLSEIWQTRPFPSASRGQAARPAMVHHGKCCGHGRDKDDEQTLRNSSRAVLLKAANFGLDQVLGSFLGNTVFAVSFWRNTVSTTAFAERMTASTANFGIALTFNHYNALQSVFCG